MLSANKLNIYMVGIKGVGMTMLAQFLKSKGHFVYGSDIADEFQTDKTLLNARIGFKSGFSVDNFPDKIDLLIHSSAYTPENNIELEFLFKQKIKKLSYAEAVGEVFNGYHGISICGSHGKTTVSAWLAYALLESEMSPNALIGSYVKQLRGNSVTGKSEYFILESDEYQNKLQYLKPEIVVLNNIDFDHPDYFKNEEEYYDVFLEFIKKIPCTGSLITNIDDQQCLRVSQNNKGKNIFYTIKDFPDIDKNSYEYLYQAKNIKAESFGQSFDLYCNEQKVARFKIKLFGEYSIYNALAVISTALNLGVTVDKLQSALFSFQGPARRADVLGEYKGAIFIDDYAHHPTEIKASLSALRQQYKAEELVVVFHPHTVSRTKTFLREFSESFSIADKIYLSEVYTSAREEKSDFSSLELLREIQGYNKKNNIKQDVQYFANFSEIENTLQETVRKNQVVLFLGAGDIFRVAYKLLKISTKDI